jgi:hypothetical protein
MYITFFAHEKLYGPVEDLKRTTNFITRSVHFKCSQAIDKKKKSNIGHAILTSAPIDRITQKTAVWTFPTSAWRFLIHGVGQIGAVWTHCTHKHFNVQTC